MVVLVVGALTAQQNKVPAVSGVERRGPDHHSTRNFQNYLDEIDDLYTLVRSLQRSSMTVFCKL